MTEFLLGVDAGNTMTKVVLFDPSGVEIGVARRRNPICFPAPGHTERDPVLMWRDVCDAIRELLQQTGVDAEAIRAVSVSGYGAGLYLVDAAGQPVRPGIMSTDTRASALLDEWTLDGRAARNATRIQQRLWAGQPAALLAWLSVNEPKVLEKTHRVLLCKDFLRAQFCDDLSTDETDAGIAGLVDVPSGLYPDAFFRDLGLEGWRDRLPAVGRSADVVGEVTAAASDACGLRAGTPVVRGMVDVCAAAVASGVSRPDQLSVIAGTFSINSTLHQGPRLDTLPFLQLAYPVGGYCLATEGSATSASNFEWYCKSILGPEAVEAAASRGRSIYDVCGERIGTVLSRRNDILFFPFLFGGPQGAPAGFIGLKAEHDGADVVRAIFEGIVFAHKLDIDVLLAGADRAPVRSIRLSGGAARSKVWAQMFADVLGLPVEVTRGGEVGARGTAMCAAVALGMQPDFGSAIAAMVQVEYLYMPDAARHATYAAKFEVFRRTMRALTTLDAEFPLSLHA